MASTNPPRSGGLINILSSEQGRQQSMTDLRNQVTKVFEGVPVQPAYVKAIADRAEKALNRLLHEIGLQQVGTQIYKPAGKKASA